MNADLGGGILKNKKRADTEFIKFTSPSPLPTTQHTNTLP